VGTVLEIGSSEGYHLNYLHQKYGFDCYGIEPSALAVESGSIKYSELRLQVGTADSLPFDDNMFDVVIIGLCLSYVDRNLLYRSVSEADRVLRIGGFLFISDFDVKVPYKRYYKHNENMSFYKMDSPGLFLANPQYSLVQKVAFTHDGDGYSTDVQERLCTVALHKDTIDNSYIPG
jgi:SAM-dependent methyltransferase